MREVKETRDKVNGTKRRGEREKKRERGGRGEKERERWESMCYSAMLPYAIISFHSGMCAEGNFREAFVYAKCYASQCNVGRLVARWLVWVTEGKMRQVASSWSCNSMSASGLAFIRFAIYRKAWNDEFSILVVTNLESS